MGFEPVLCLIELKAIKKIYSEILYYNRWDEKLAISGLATVFDNFYCKQIKINYE